MYLLKDLLVLVHDLCGLLVERVVGVWLEKEVEETVDDRLQIQYRTPVLAQNVQAHVACAGEREKGEEEA